MAGHAQFFYALEPHGVSRDKFFKIYIRDADLCGVLLGRQVYDEDSVLRQLIAPAQIFGPLMQIWAKRILKKVRAREVFYDGLELSGDDFLAHDKANFRLYRQDILSLFADTKKRLWTGRSEISGTLKLKLRSGETREFIVTRGQDLGAIVTRLGFPEIASALEPPSQLPLSHE